MISKSIISELSKMNIDELRQLNSYVVSMIKEYKTDLAYETKNRLRVGDNVKVDSPKTRGLMGSVIEINRTRCKVRFSNGTFNVPLSMIKFVI
jgi:transcription antitermination factor NusG